MRKIIIASSLILVSFIGNAQDVKTVVKSDDIKEVKCTTPPSTSKRIAKHTSKKVVRPSKTQRIERSKVEGIPVKE